MISNNAIKEAAGAVTYERGRQLFENGYVLDMDAECIDGKDFIESTVQGSGRKTYEVKLLLNAITGELEGSFCECPAFYSYEGICKHCVAAWLEYKAEQGTYDRETESPLPLDSIPGVQRGIKKRTSPELAALFQKQALKRSLPIIQNDIYGKVKLEPEFQFNGYQFLVEFKIGVSRMYVLKDVMAFGERIKNESNYSYGKALEFHHTLQAFGEESRSLAEFLLEWSENYRAAHTHVTYGGYYLDYSDKVRQISLRGNEIADFLLTVMGRTILGSVAGTRQKSWKVTDEKLSRTLTITGEEDGIELKVSKFTWGGESGEYRICFHDGKIYLESKKELEPIMGFLNSMTAMGDRAGYIEKKDVPLFCRDYLPVLKQYYKCRMSGFHPEDYQMELPELKVYLDAPQRNLITAKPVVVIGKRELSLYGTEQMAAREMNQEQLVKEILGKYSNAFDPAQDSMVIADDDEMTYEFLTEGIPKLQNLAEIYISDALKKIEVRSAPKAAVGVSLEGNLLELKLTAGDLSKEELIDILSRYNRKKKFYRLKDGTFVSAQDSGLDTMAELKEGLGLTDRELQKEQIPVPRYRALYLDTQLKEDTAIGVWKDKAFRSLIRNMKTIEDNDFELPKKLETILREYQKKGFLWLKTLEHNGFGGILADDMGLGKTLQVIALLLSDFLEQKEEGAKCDRGTLIVSPASLVYNWKSEFEKFAPELSVYMVTGTAAKRAELIKNAGMQDVLLTSYDLLKRDVQEYERYSFRSQVIDEAQYIKNHNTQAAKAVKEIRAGFKLALTGTPVENRLSELWSIFDYLMPGFLYGYKKFHEELEIPIVQNSDGQAMKRLQKMIAPFVLRRLKKDVLTDLPEKLEETMVAQLSGEQQELYDAHVKRMMLMLDKQSEEEFRTSKITILSELTRLRQLCCDPGLVYEDYKGESAKTELCVNMIKNAVEGGHKLLLFSQFTSMLDRLAERLEKEQIRYHMLTGATDKAKRAEMTASFAEDEIPVFLISLKAGGTGLNLTAADIVIHFDPWWNLAVQNQATDRAHRIGQKCVVNVYKLVMKDTIEENIIKLQEKKKELADQILNGENLNGSSLTREDLMELLKGE